MRLEDIRKRIAEDDKEPVRAWHYETCCLTCDDVRELLKVIDRCDEELRRCNEKLDTAARLTGRDRLTVDLVTMADALDRIKSVLGT